METHFCLFVAFLVQFSFPEAFPKYNLRAVALGFHLIQLHLQDGGGRELVEDEQVWGDEDEGGEDGQDQDQNHLRKQPLPLPERKRCTLKITVLNGLNQSGTALKSLCVLKLKSGTD